MLDGIETMFSEQDYETVKSLIEAYGFSETINGAIYHDRERLLAAQQVLRKIRAEISIFSRKNDVNSNPQLEKMKREIDTSTAISVAVYNALPDNKIIDNILGSKNSSLIIQILKYIESAGVFSTTAKNIANKFGLSKAKCYRIIRQMMEMRIIYPQFTNKRSYIYSATSEGKTIIRHLARVKETPIVKLVELEVE